MFKLVMKFTLFILFTLTSSTLFAQSFFGSGAPKSTQGPQTQAGTPGKVLSPQEFSSKVNTLNQKTRSSVKQQLKQTLTAPPTPAPPKISPSTTPPKDQTDANQPGSLTATPVAPANQAPQQAPTYTPPPAAAPERPTVEDVLPPSQPEAAPNQPYTGFGAGTNQGNSGTKNNSSGSSSGLGIKY